MAWRAMMARRDGAGFARVNVLVVAVGVIVAGVLAVVALALVFGNRSNADHTRKTQDRATEIDLRNAAAAMESYFVDNETYAGASEATLRTLGYEGRAFATAPVIAANGKAYCIAIASGSGATFSYTGGSTSAGVATGIRMDSCPASGEL